MVKPRISHPDIWITLDRNLLRTPGRATSLEDVAIRFLYKSPSTAELVSTEICPRAVSLILATEPTHHRFPCWIMTTSVSVSILNTAASALPKHRS